MVEHGVGMATVKHPLNGDKPSGQMKILTWNVRGLGDDKKTTLVYQTLLNLKPDIICLQETKLTTIDNFKAIRFLPTSLRSYHHHPSTLASGGILTAWCSAKFDASLLHTDTSSLSIAFQSKTDRLQFSITNIYAPFDDQERQPFFNALANIRLNGPRGF